MKERICTLSRFIPANLPGRNLAIAMTLFLVLSGLMAPIMPMVDAATVNNIAADQANRLQGDDEDEDQLENEEVQEDQPQEEELTEEDPVELDPIEDPENGEFEPLDEEEDTSVSISVSAQWCPEGTNLMLDPLAAKDQLFTACQVQGPAVTITILGTPHSAAVTTFPGGLFAEFLEANSYLVQVSTTPGIEEVFFCEAFGPTENGHGNTKPYALRSFVQTGYSVEADPGEQVICNWFGNAPAQGDGISLTLYKWECPEGTMYGNQHDYYSAECDTQQAGVPFQITDDNGTQDTTSDIDGRQINDLVGQITIQETIPAGFGVPVVFCQLLNDANSTQMTVTNGTVELPAATDDDYQCFWYNMPEGDGISLTLYKWECPEGTMYGNQHDYYSAECDMEQAGVPFQITDDNGTQNTTSDTNGRQINDLVGQITIQETIPAGFGDPVVFCQLLNDPASTLYTSTSGLVTLPAATDDDYQCFWYNIPGGDGISLTLYKWECPEGTMYGNQHDYYSAECDMERAGVPFQITDDNGTQDTTSDTNGRQIDNLSGQITIQETIPAGFGVPVVFCQLLNDANSTQMTVTNGTVTLQPALDDDYQCFWYNVPEDPSTVVIYKWECPQGVERVFTIQWHQDNCTQPMDGVEFVVTDANGPRSKTTSGGMVTFDDVATGAVQIAEIIPYGYSPNPYLICQVTEPGGGGTPQFTPTTINGVWNTSIAVEGSELRCDWYNEYLGPGNITVYKWTCPEGYDRHAWGADPTVDCTEATNGVTFMLDQPDPEVDLYSDTGDSIDGAVYFGGLTPGTYTLTEVVSPADMYLLQDVFVWACYGLTGGAVHPVPLNVGYDFTFDIYGGDEIVCHWYNVPWPEYGWITVTKYNCTTEKYLKDVYCYTNQTGQEFNLQFWVQGTGWVTVQSGKTDVSGKLSFHDLEEGAYRLVEPNTEACLTKSSNITSGGYIGVEAGYGTAVYVYNCKKPAPPTKTPTKYPNTGVGSAAESDVTWTPGIELAGLMGLLGLRLNRRRMVTGAALATAGAAASALPFVQAQPLQPIDHTPAPGTPDPADFGCGATPEAWTQPEGTPDEDSSFIDPCNRGAIPIHMRIPEIDVDAPMEYLEIIDGLMQQPTGAEYIAWYKETNRLGEVGNGIYAAHLNWWGIPQGIFFRLESLQEGDVIEIDGDNLQTYIYEVRWSQNFPSDEEPPEEALGLTEEVSITLITCGGEWSSSLAEYDHRTLVRAVLREE